ncbi:hypothetical protein O59_000960 [Cellvibrio sp. BR]|nr:hypothetical protein O59_000960 [Cellvibrio sp. BR]
MFTTNRTIPPPLACLARVLHPRWHGKKIEPAKAKAKVWPNRQFFIGFLQSAVYGSEWHAICSTRLIFLSR